jgi:hypothetical protein
MKKKTLDLAEELPRCNKHSIKINLILMFRSFDFNQPIQKHEKLTKDECLLFSSFALKLITILQII